MSTASEKYPMTRRLQSEAVAFDVSGYGGRLRVSGEDAIDLLDRLTTNDLSQLRPGTGAGTVLTNSKGRVIDFLRVLHRGGDLLVLTGAGAQKRIIEWIDFYTFSEDVSVEDVSGDTAQFLVVGEGAAEAMSAAFPIAAGLDGFLDHAGAEGATAVRGKLGALDAWEAILPREAGAPDFGLPTLSEAERDRLRIEQGVGKYLREWSEYHSTNPLEANLKPYVSFNKGCYIGQEVVARLNAYDRVKGFLALLEFDCADDLAMDGSIVMLEEDVIEGEGVEVGAIMSPAPGLALAYLRKRRYEDGARIAAATDDGGIVYGTARDIRPPAYFE